MLSEWLFGEEEEEEEDGKGILNDNIALSLERQCKEGGNSIQFNSKWFIKILSLRQKPNCKSLHFNK